jgi:DNA-binding NtrC family response regulator
MKNSRNTRHVILIVEDESLIRLCAGLDLEEAGFGVIDAADAEEALRIFRGHPEITTLFTDINMPGAFDGLALALKVFKLRPGVQIIITSGRAEPQQSEMPAGACFLPKPYTRGALSALIRGDTAPQPAQFSSCSASG